MDIPNDLNRLLARLQEVTSQKGQVGETGPPGSRPTAAEVDFFLSQYGFGSDTMIERIEISKEGVFEFYMFAVWNRGNDELSLLAMRAERRWPTGEGEPFRSGE
jgi:hypothetical protein